MNTGLNKRPAAREAEDTKLLHKSRCIIFMKATDHKQRAEIFCFCDCFPIVIGLNVCELVGFFFFSHKHSVSI